MQAAAVHAEAVALPASVDLTPYAMPVGNQGPVGSCAAWAADYSALGYWENKQGIAGGGLEPMFTYAQVTGGRDVGSTIEGNLYIDQTQGVDNQADHWQGNFDYSDQPATLEMGHAVNWKLSSFADLPVQPSSSSTVTRQSIEGALAAGMPVVIGIPVYDNFFYVGTANQGYYAGISGNLDGYHAITALGYNSSGLVIENSWGTGWGNRGYATLSWSFVNSYVFDAVSVSALRTGQPANTVAPALPGSASQGQPLTVSTGTWSPSATSFAYQWERQNTDNRSWAPIAGATAASYTPGSADLGRSLRVLVSASNAGGQGAVTSTQTGAINPGAPADVTAPSVSGAASRGTTLQASTGSWSPTPTSYAYQWQRLTGSTWANLPGATASSYTPSVGDENASLRVSVTGTNAYGQLMVPSAPTAPVKASPPVSTAPPRISGTPATGRTLNAAIGSWLGMGNAYAYQWQRSTGGAWANIPGATGANYTLASADAGATLRVVVVASNPDGVASAASPVAGRVPSASAH